MEQNKLKIFISYSRKDCAAFAEDLLAGLELLGFDPFLDLHDIAAGEDWEERLAGLIQASDTMVYALSPASVKSEICAWEVEEALKVGKRLIPIVALPIDDADVPTSLKRLNYIFFDKPHSYAKALAELSQALKTDLDWIREHTRLSELAGRWEIREKLDAQLLRGAELNAASAWMADWKTGAPDVPDTVRKFIQSSSEAQTNRANKERQQLEQMAEAQEAKAKALSEQEVAVGKLSRRTTMGLIGAGVLTTAAGGLAYWGTDAERRFRIAEEQRKNAEKNSLEKIIRKQAMRNDIEGQIAAHAASPGQLAMDGDPGENSPYTNQLLVELANRDISILDAFASANPVITRNSGNRQRPFLSTDMNGNIYLQRQPDSRKRIAIIISVDTGPFGSKFKNVERDAAAWKLFLGEKCGFEVKQLKNPGLAQFENIFDNTILDRPKQQGYLSHPLLHKVGFTEKKPPKNSLLMFVYAGGGYSLNGINYLVPYGVKAKTDDELIQSSIAITKIKSAMNSSAAASILVLDTAFPNIGRETR